MNDRLERNKQSAVAFYDFRMDEDGKVVEHWDVLQIVPDELRNNNTMF